MQNHGIWIGNTGYGYGDSELIAYSERLSVLFLEELTRCTQDGCNQQSNSPGVSVGEALQRAKQRFVASSGPGGLNVYAEKAMLEWTLYGLPNIRVKVPGSSVPFLQETLLNISNLIAPSQLSQGFTRLITFTNSFEEVPLSSGKLTRSTSQVEDSFSPGIKTIQSSDQVNPGRPVLPLVTYDLSLSAFHDLSKQPRVQQVRLVRASSYEHSFEPHIAVIVSDTLNTAPPEIGFEGDGTWVPDLFYSTIRLRDGKINNIETWRDLLQINPVQYQQFGDQVQGKLRRYDQLVFEVTYIAEESAPPNLSNDLLSPLVASVSNLVKGLTGLKLLKVTAVADDSKSGNTGINQVNALYQEKGEWKSVPMQRTDAGFYEIELPISASGELPEVIIEAHDGAGNLTRNTPQPSTSEASEEEPELPFIPKLPTANHTVFLPTVRN